MKPVLLTISAVLMIIGLTAAAAAAQSPAKTDPPKPPAELTLNDCLTLLPGLNGLDGRTYVVNAGKATEQAVTLPYEFGNSRLRLDIARNIAQLVAVQRDADQVRQKIFMEVGKGAPEIKPGSPESVEYDRQLRELTARPCGVTLARIKAKDLKLDKNEIPGSVIGALDKILDRATED